MRNSNQHIAILSFSQISSDARVLRQVQYLSQHYSINVIGFGDLPQFSHINMLSLDPVDLPINLSIYQKLGRRIRSGQFLPYFQLFLGQLLPARFYEAWYWSHPEYRQAYQYLLASRPKFIHANDWTSLPATVHAARKIDAKVVADLHEYAPLEMGGIIWKLFLKPLREFIIRRYIPETIATVTVNNTIADMYKRSFGFSPIVVMNTPMINREISFRQTNPNQIRLIHHGGMAHGRNPESMIKTAALLDRQFELSFMLLGDKREIQRLQSIAQVTAPGKVSFRPPVRPDQVTHEISQFDIGFYLLPGNNFNNSVSSPNKFFDFIHAGLAICIGPSPEMARMCNEYGFGVVSASFSPQIVANMINQLTPDTIDVMKKASIKARYVLNADVELGKLVNLYDQLFNENT